MRPPPRSLSRAESCAERRSCSARKDRAVIFRGRRHVNKTARITIELSGKTLENLILLATKLHRHPDDLTVDLLYAAIEASVDSTEAQMALMAQSTSGLLQ